MDAHHRVRARGGSHLRISWPRYRHTDSGCGAADVVAANCRGDVRAQFLHQQSHSHGTHVSHRFPCR
jgi:hypothetical protein